MHGVVGAGAAAKEKQSSGQYSQSKFHDSAQSVLGG
jgi:hypothetical protein